MMCSPLSAPSCLGWKDVVLARRRLAVEQSIRRHVTRLDRRCLNGRMPLLLGSECVGVGVSLAQFRLAAKV